MFRLREVLPDVHQGTQAENLRVEQKGPFSTLDFLAYPRALWRSSLKERAKEGSLKASCTFYQAKIKSFIPQTFIEPLLCARYYSREQLDKNLCTPGAHMLESKDQQ